MVLSCVAFLEANQGRLLAWRDFRGDVSRQAIVDFGQGVIKTRETEHSPVCLRAGTSFMYLRENDVFLVAATQFNSNALMSFELLRQIADTLRQYYGGLFSADKVRPQHNVLALLLIRADFHPAQDPAWLLLSHIREPRVSDALCEWHC